MSNVHQQGHAPELPSTHDLLMRLQAGDAAAVDVLFARFAGQVYHRARVRGWSHHDADDLVMRVFERILTRIDHYDPSQGGGGGWIWVLVEHALVDAFRESERLPKTAPLDREISEVFEEDRPDLAVERRAHCLDQVKRSLSPDEEAILWRRLKPGRPSRKWHVVADQVAARYHACLEGHTL